jgi:hypothetical protein
MKSEGSGAPMPVQFQGWARQGEQSDGAIWTKTALNQLAKMSFKRDVPPAHALADRRTKSHSQGPAIRERCRCSHRSDFPV